MIDSFRHKGLRKKLVEELRQKGISNEYVLEAIGNIPRHFFMDSGFIQYSYKDQAFPIASGQTISQPFTVAYQTELLDPKEHEKILEVGTGSGYQTAVLMELTTKVYTIERQWELYIKAQQILGDLGYKPHFFYGDGYEGVPSYSPYDKILVTAGASDIPEKLIGQLKVGGKMVVPVGSSSNQVMTVVDKKSENEIKKTEHGDFIFVPLLKGVSKK